MASAQDESHIVAIEQNGKSNLIVIFDNDTMIETIDLRQQGTINNISLVQRYGEQFVTALQSGNANYAHSLQLNGEQSFLVLSQDHETQEPVWINTTIMTKEAVDSSYLWTFMSGDMRVSVFADDRQVSVLGRTH